VPSAGTPPIRRSPETESQRGDTKTRRIPDGRGLSTTTTESPPPCHIGPITRAMARKLEEDWNTATDARETYLCILKDAIVPSVE